MARHHSLADLDLGDLVHQISALRRDLSGPSHSLTRAASHAAADWGHTAADFGNELVHQGERVARGVSKRAVKAGHAIQKDPMPTVIALAGFACLMSLILGRRRD